MDTQGVIGGVCLIGMIMGVYVFHGNGVRCYAILFEMKCHSVVIEIPELCTPATLGSYNVDTLSGHTFTISDIRGLQCGCFIRSHIHHERH